MHLHEWLAGIYQFVSSQMLWNALIALALIVLHATAYGATILKLLKLSFEDDAAHLCVTMSLGLTCFGFQIWGMGYFGLWNVPTFLTSGLISALVIALIVFRQSRGSRVVDSTSTDMVFTAKASSDEFAPSKRTFDKASATAVLNPVAKDSLSAVSSPVLAAQVSKRGWYERTLLALIICMLCVVVLAAIKPPYMIDEREYHWVAPLAWAGAGHWIAVPFRYMNGACLGQLFYLVGALFNSSTAAHWTHGLFFLILMAGCMSLTRMAGGSLLAVSAACLSTPVLVNQAAWSFNDLSFAALSLAGLVAILRTRERGSHQIKVFLVAGIILAGAFSVKALAPAVALAYIVAVILSEKLAEKPLPARVLKIAVVAFAFTLAIAIPFGLWKLHTKYLTNSFESTPLIILPANQSLREHQEALGKVPSVRSLIELPLLPFITPIFGQQEPYGSRTGFVAAPFALMLFFFWRKLEPTKRKRCAILLATCAAYFLIVGAITVRVRYLNFSWAILLCLAAVGVETARVSLSGRARLAVSIAFCLAVVLGMLDSAHVLLHWPGKEMTPIIPHFALTE